MPARVRDKWTGRGKQVRGKLKEKYGQLTGKRKVQAQGLGEQVGGKLQETLAKAREKMEKLRDKALWGR
jgi:uncharacterized protein YjbJ (UPF0337 family)